MRDMNTGTPVPNGWILCYIDQDDAAYYRTSCSNLIRNVMGHANGQDLLNAGGNFGCWHGRTGSQKGASYASNNVVKYACRDNIQQSTALSTWKTSTTTLGVCIRLK